MYSIPQITGDGQRRSFESSGRKYGSDEITADVVEEEVVDESVDADVDVILPGKIV